MLTPTRHIMTRRVVSCGLLGRRTCLCVRLNDGTCVKAKRLTRWIWTEAAVCGLTVMKVKHCRWHRSGHFKRTTSCGSLTNALRRQRLTTGARIRERKGTASLNKRLSSQVYSSTKGREKKSWGFRVRVERETRSWCWKLPLFFMCFHFDPNCSTRLISE